MLPDEELHRHATKTLDRADALLFGRVTYEMMESTWRPPGQTEAMPGQTEAMPDWMAPFGRTIDAARKYVVSSTLDWVDWNAELVRGDLGKAVQELKRESGKGLLVGGVKLPLALAELGLIDEYEFVVQPRLTGHGPTLFAGLSKYVELKLVSRLELGSGAVALRYVPRTQAVGLRIAAEACYRSRVIAEACRPREEEVGLVEVLSHRQLLSDAGRARRLVTAEDDDLVGPLDPSLDLLLPVAGQVVLDRGVLDEEMKTRAAMRRPFSPTLRTPREGCRDRGRHCVATHQQRTRV